MLYQCSYIGDADTKNFYLSPLFGIIRVLPMLMQVGSARFCSATHCLCPQSQEGSVKVRTLL